MQIYERRFTLISFGTILIVLWDSRIAFGNGTVTLHCYKYYLSIMNLTSQTESELESILEACDGKQHCTIPTSQNLKYNTINFYCTGKYICQKSRTCIFLWFQHLHLLTKQIEEHIHTNRINLLFQTDV